ncbi:MAG: PfkB family carbohydrate kinase [Kiritimatiellae bacterium]|nr:PfkB family carbohydrate kinase [Kiritimatiellia bacterium]
MHKKIIFLNDLISKVQALQKKNKVVVQSHGVFDIIHPGVVQHLNAAKEQGDILVVTVIKDKDVKSGPGRPIFNEQLRLENVASLEQVDFVALVNEDVPFDCVRLIKPDIFAKGKAFKDRDQAVHGKIFARDKELYFGKIKIFETDGFSFSSQQIVNNFLEIYPGETKKFLKELGRKYTFKNIVERMNKLKRLKVLIIGDGIIDEYHYCESLGKSAKNPLVANRYLTHESFAGGAFAIANHIASLCEQVHLVTVLGKNDSRETFISDNLKPNVTTKLFFRDDGPTIVKKRYIHQYSNQKLFEVNYLNDKPINADCENKIAAYLENEIDKYDIVLVSDFGHGLITHKLIKLIEREASKYAVNTQTNAANAGYNMLTKYLKPYFICVDETELRLAAQDKHAAIDNVARGIKFRIKAQYLIVTRGQHGSLGVGKNDDVNCTPIFSTKVIDTIGAGDAFFAFTAPCFAVGMPLDLVSFIGNAVGALAVQIMGNKKPVEKYELLEFVHNLLK